MNLVYRWKKDDIEESIEALKLDKPGFESSHTEAYSVALFNRSFI